MPSDLPFEISREVRKGLSEQMVDGIRDAIVAGHWRIGQRVPSLKRVADLAGVSMKVSRMAYRQLCDEGWLHVTPSIGYTAVTPNVSVWRGRVLLILPLPGYFNRNMAKQMQIASRRRAISSPRSRHSLSIAISTRMFWRPSFCNASTSSFHICRFLMYDGCFKTPVCRSPSTVRCATFFQSPRI